MLTKAELLPKSSELRRPGTVAKTWPAAVLAPRQSRLQLGVFLEKVLTFWFWGDVHIFYAKVFQGLLEGVWSWYPARQYPGVRFLREYDGACLQMRMSYSPAAHLFLFLVQWIDCHLAGALGLLRILIYKVYVDGTTTMSTHERKASVREFYAVIYPSLLQLQKGVSLIPRIKGRRLFVWRGIEEEMMRSIGNLQT